MRAVVLACVCVCVCVRERESVCASRKGGGRRVEEGIPFNCNHSGSTAGIYMPCIQLERRGEERRRRGEGEFEHVFLNKIMFVNAHRLSERTCLRLDCISACCVSTLCLCHGVIICVCVCTCLLYTVYAFFGLAGLIEIHSSSLP